MKIDNAYCLNLRFWVSDSEIIFAVSSGKLNLYRTYDDDDE